MATTCVLRIDGAGLWFGFPPETWEGGFGKCCRDDQRYRAGDAIYTRRYASADGETVVTVQQHAVFCGSCGARLWVMSYYEADVTLSFDDWKAIMLGAAKQIGPAVAVQPVCMKE